MVSAGIIEGFSFLASVGILREGRDALVEARLLHGLIDGFSIYTMTDPDCMSSDVIRALLKAHLSQSSTWPEPSQETWRDPVGLPPVDQARRWATTPRAVLMASSSDAGLNQSGSPGASTSA